MIIQQSQILRIQIFRFSAADSTFKKSNDDFLLALSLDLLIIFVLYFKDTRYFYFSIYQALTKIRNLFTNGCISRSYAFIVVMLSYRVQIPHFIYVIPNPNSVTYLSIFRKTLYWLLPLNENIDFKVKACSVALAKVMPSYTCRHRNEDDIYISWAYL